MTITDDRRLRVTIYEQLGPHTKRVVARLYAPGPRVTVEVQDRHGKVLRRVFNMPDPERPPEEET